MCPALWKMHNQFFVSNWVWRGAVIFGIIWSFTHFNIRNYNYLENLNSDY